MCRLFGMLSVKPRNAHEFLIGSECSLLKQSYCRKEREQGDGWGIGYYVGHSLHIIKSPKPVYNERNQFSLAASEAKSRIILAHVRRASNPLKMPKRKLLTPENTQPFSHKSIMFAHNGTIQIPNEVMEHLGSYRRMVKGTNDSEVYFWLLMKNFDGNDMAKAFVKSVETLWALWEDCREQHSDANGPYVGLNCIMSDGKKIHAFCKYDGVGKEALCYGADPYFRMCYTLKKDYLVIASERMNRTHDWKPIENNVLLEGKVKDGKVEVSKKDLYPSC